MFWRVKTFILVEEDEPTIYQEKAEADSDADQAMFMQPGEVITVVVECDEDGNEI